MINNENAEKLLAYLARKNDEYEAAVADSTRAHEQDMANRSKRNEVLIREIDALIRNSLCLNPNTLALLQKAFRLTVRKYENSMVDASHKSLTEVTESIQLVSKLFDNDEFDYPVSKDYIPLSSFINQEPPIGHISPFNTSCWMIDLQVASTNPKSPIVSKLLGGQASFTPSHMKYVALKLINFAKCGIGITLPLLIQDEFITSEARKKQQQSHGIHDNINKFHLYNMDNSADWFIHPWLLKSLGMTKEEVEQLYLATVNDSPITLELFPKILSLGRIEASIHIKPERVYSDLYIEYFLSRQSEGTILVGGVDAGVCVFEVLEQMVRIRPDLNYIVIADMVFTRPNATEDAKKKLVEFINLHDNVSIAGAGPVIDKYKKARDYILRV